MKTLSLLFTLLVITACASKEPATETQAEPTPTPTTAVEAPVKKDTPKKKEVKVKELHKEGTATAGTCKFNDEVRTIEVKETESGGCEVMYSKGGEASSVASAVQGSEHCQKVAEKIKTNLTNAGFTCE